MGNAIRTHNLSKNFRRVEVVEGVLGAECAELIKNFFSARR